MATLDLDPVFVKALKLLHSKSKDATDQLRQMLEDVIAQRKGHTKVKTSNVEGEKILSKSSGEKSTKKEEDTSKRKEAEKTTLDKLKREPSEQSSSEVPAKKPRSEPPFPEKESSQSKEKHSDREKDKDREREKDKERDRKKDKETREKEKKEALKKEEREKEKEKYEKEQKEKNNEKQKQKEKEKKKMEKVFDESTDEEEEMDMDKSMDADDFAVGLGIACVVCKQFDVTSMNQLVECQECHSLYHQECHRPPVIEQDVNDPRFVWYCSRCEKSLKKMVSKAQKPKTSSSAPPEKVAPAPKTPKPEATSLFSFRREPKVSTVKDTTTNSGAKPLSGLASLAANLSGQSKSSSKSETVKPVSSKSDLLKHSSSSKLDQIDKPSTLASQPKERLKSVDVSNSSVSGSSSSKHVSKSDSSKPLTRSPTDPFKTLTKSSSDAGKSLARQSSNSKTSQGGSSSVANADKRNQGGASSVANADKRLQMMKKKAAAKLQEKRSSMK